MGPQNLPTPIRDDPIFLQRALELAAPGASVLCSIPPRLTRPGIVTERQQLLRSLTQADVEIVSLDTSVTRYLVPRFERIALQDLPGFDGRPWRTGDLLHIRTHGEVDLHCNPVARPETLAFARNPKLFRAFLRRPGTATDGLATWLSVEKAFSETVSRREYDPSELQWWTSEKSGGLVRNYDATKRALELWSQNLDRETTQEKLAEHGGLSPDDCRALCQDLDDHLRLWRSHGIGRIAPRADLAVRTTSGRPYPKKEEDGFRDAFQRDRDRITWSRGLRQLANKTQVFPLATGDYLRNRLAHSLEVAQLATTIGASFGLNLSLIEAGGLAHDIGHTPFGHAGEYALHNLFQELKADLHFNHYEHW